MRDPAVQALLALTLSPADLAAIEAGEPLERRFWPVQAAQGGVVVGLAVGDRVVGEAPLVRVEPNPRGGARWVFGALVRYLVPPPHTPRRRSPWAEMPVCPLGTLTPATAPMW